MIDENTESDILGAITADRNPSSKMKWRPVLVETGVHKAGTTPNHKPSTIQPNVLEAVKWAIREETGEEVIQGGARAPTTAARTSTLAELDIPVTYLP